MSFVQDEDERSRGKHITVIVLGDFGRSPRMQYHTSSLLKNNYYVDVVAYKGAEPLSYITGSHKVRIHYMREVPSIVGKFPRLMQYILKSIWQYFFLIYTLLQIPKMDCMFVQNPPSIPTLPACWFMAWLKRCSVFIDFHNYGYTILSLSAGQNSRLVKMAERCEKIFGQKAEKSICVTKAMKEDLAKNWKIRASVFYDCAPDLFHPIDVAAKHSFFMELSQEYEQFQSAHTICEDEECTRFTRKVGRDCQMLPDRPALIVSSTSWTDDEDFSILLHALEDYDYTAIRKPELPDLVVAITGKGPLKSYYERLIEEKNFARVQIVTLWLKFEDYPTFLACADLGVSLHSSSSGLDLPMKVVDMFGCCLPVAALSFNCIHELVKHGVNGKVFRDHAQLSLQLQELLGGFPNKRTELGVFRDNLRSTRSLRWEENWDHTVAPLFRDIIARRIAKGIRDS